MNEMDCLVKDFEVLRIKIKEINNRIFIGTNGILNNIIIRLLTIMIKSPFLYNAYFKLPKINQENRKKIIISFYRKKK